MRRSVAVRALACVSVALTTLRCNESPTPPGGVLENSIGVIVSGPITPGISSALRTSSATVTTSEVFVSLSPGSVPAGVTAAIRNRRTGVGTTTALVNGGFDPVPLGAEIGDTLDVTIAGAPPTTSIRASLRVDAARAPRIVRTNPPSGGRDVPLNATVVVVFSEPIDSAALSNGSIQLLRDTTPTAGTLRFGDAYELRVELNPASLLASETAYRLHVSTAIRSLNGAALDSPLDVLFTTGTFGAATDLVFASVSAGSNYTCGVDTGGAAYCWGDNFAGQLGNGTTASSMTPVPVAGGLTFASLSTNDWYTCGVTTSGAAYCWGRTDLLGADPAALGACPTATSSGGSFHYCLTPVPVAGGLTFASVSAGYGHACGITTGGAAYCWGGDWDMGELGAAGPFDPSTPVAVSGGLSFVTVSAGDYFTCGVTTTGAAYCWGANFGGDLGVDTLTGPEHCGTTDQGGGTTVVPCSRKPVAVGGNLTFVTVSAGIENACGVTSAGAAYCWGANGVGQHGDGTTLSNATPVPVGGGLTFTSVSSSKGNHTCGVTQTQATYCWGGDNVGQLGDGATATSRLMPVPVVGGSFAAVSAGDFHTCGVTTGGTAYCWGINSFGELGTGTTTGSSVPLKVAGQP